VAKHTLVRLPIPRPFRGKIALGLTTIGKEALWHGDHVATILLPDKPVDRFAVNTRHTGPSFKVQYHCRLADKVLWATEVLERAGHVRWAMGTRSHVIVQVARRVKHTPTLGAVVMNLSIVLVQTLIVPEEPVTTLAVGMCIDAVFQQRYVVEEVGVALAAEGVVRALDPLLSETSPRIKILVTV